MALALRFAIRLWVPIPANTLLRTEVAAARPCHDRGEPGKLPGAMTPAMCCHRDVGVIIPGSSVRGLFQLSSLSVLKLYCPQGWHAYAQIYVRLIVIHPQ